eukprot:CAMPEP_0181105714 /NCGR_PEP_ID=MMETSP1071-20121207/16138_1 /TAXON_ID=35127 /ORGANISM="Thalassiosira sp., Strain NH16" /LENGTH=490 /DNA_ID=CAMNT_0023189057 /DNA_START=119 /DNA_END=1588 /DNA_ORIENTATION=+
MYNTSQTKPLKKIGSRNIVWILVVVVALVIIQILVSKGGSVLPSETYRGNKVVSVYSRAKNNRKNSDDDQFKYITDGVEGQVVSELKQPKCRNLGIDDKDLSTNSTLDTIANNTANNPGLFIHVGPVKTGSSSIQCNLQVNPFLKLSSYKFLGRPEQVCPKTTFQRQGGKLWDLQAFVFRYILRGWLGQTDTNKDFENYVNKFKATFQNYFEEGLNSIFSAEEFCGLLDLEKKTSENERLIQLFADLLNDIPQVITFQVVHRYGFEWALSNYQFSEIWGKINLKSMEDKDMDSILAHKDIFLDYSPDNSCSPYKIWRFLRRKLIPLLDRATIKVINFNGNDGDDVATRYICSLPGAEKACQKSREIVKLDIARPTNADILHADRIVTAAWKEGMIANRSSYFANGRKEIREILINHVQHGLNSTFYEMPLECLSAQELSMSLGLSLCIGKYMLGEKFNATDVGSMFTRAKSKNKFCSVNVTALFSEDPSW